MKHELSETIRILRWNGNEIRYNEQDTSFVHEMLSHNLGMKNAKLVYVQKCGPSSWQCVIIDLPDDKEEDEEYLNELAQNAEPNQKCFLVEYSRPDYEKLTKSRSKTKNNVFDLYMGMYPEYEDSLA